MSKRSSKAQSKTPGTTPGPKLSLDLEVAEPVGAANTGLSVTGLDRLTFDGYSLTWHGSNAKSWSAFSGPEDESADEATKDVGPTPQGFFAIDPAVIEDLQPTPDWGSHRVRLAPYASTVDRMKSCLKVIRTGMYIHGGEQKGTHGCIELNNDADETEFFSLLKKYGKKIELEVRYAGAREKKYEVKACPYP
ncbi:L,D-transpeptidase [Pseudomonas sp. NPDC096925]|uniref:L,D-transpeptidase n=1 Tax=Pseudomonas sp. NPDC096925 TaxID=3364484 RepID=UPI00383A7CBD